MPCRNRKISCHRCTASIRCPCCASRIAFWAKHTTPRMRCTTPLRASRATQSILPRRTTPEPGGYAMVITERKAIDLLRARQRSDAAEIDENISVDFPDSGERALARCMAQLPPRYREILLLRFVYGYSMRETAAMMDIPFTTVGKLSQRAKERLYELCRNEGVL